MSEPNGSHPDSKRVEFTTKGDGVYVQTPCHGTRVLFPSDEAVPGAVLRTVCPRDGREWLVELVADDETETGLRPVWTDPEDQGEGR